jgi:hypothetical protein
MSEISAERRRFSRRRALKGGEIAFNLGHSVIDCTIREFSDGGARLVVENTVGIPNEFALAFQDGRPARRCRVVWRKGQALGVEFFRSPKEAQ